MSCGDNEYHGNAMRKFHLAPITTKPKWYQDNGVSWPLILHPLYSIHSLVIIFFVFFISPNVFLLVLLLHLLNTWRVWSLTFSSASVTCDETFFTCLIFFQDKIYVIQHLLIIYIYICTTIWFNKKITYQNSF